MPMYGETKADIAANTPDAYVSVAHVGKKVRSDDDMLGHPIPKDFSVNAKGLEDEQEQVKRLASEKTNHVSTAATEKVGRLSSMAAERLENTSSGIKEKADEIHGLAGKAEKLASYVKVDAGEAVRHGEDAVDRVKIAEAELRR
ncbi:MAG: hypothetical protein M1831_003497 [Alyxoria varia]|nr:MAG: hypothetical protein M1831_003497 [Alyxoria varia]